MERDLHAARPQPAPPGPEPGPQYLTPHRCAVCGLPIEWRGGGAFRHVARLDDEVITLRLRKDGTYRHPRGNRAMMPVEEPTESRYWLD
jgi:hypothetical protein